VVKHDLFKIHAIHYCSYLVPVDVFVLCLGHGPTGIENIKAHPFFASINWEVNVYIVRHVVYIRCMYLGCVIQ